MQGKRLTAKIVTVKELCSGDYVTAEGWNPNFVKANGRLIHRANVMAAIISPPEEGPGLLSFMVDDGTGRMIVRVFEGLDRFKELQAGEVVTIIGRPREFSGERYLVPELIKRVRDPLWVEVRKKMYERAPNKEQEDLDAPAQQMATSAPNKPEEVKVEAIDRFQAVSDAIQKLDEGDGADYDAVVGEAAVDGADKVIALLIQEGEVFEFTPGKLKLLK